MSGICFELICIVKLVQRATHHQMTKTKGVGLEFCSGKVVFSKSIYHQPDIFYKGKIVHQSLKNGLGVSEIRLTQNSLFHFSFLNIGGLRNQANTKQFVSFFIFEY